MIANLLNTFYLAIAFLALFANAELLYHKLGVKAEWTRKYVHLVTGLLTLLFPPLIGNHWLVLILCSSFLIILLVSLRFRLLPSINGVNRVTRGSILYPTVVYGCYLVFHQYDQYLFYYIPILILAISDPVAALVGKKWPIWKYRTFGHQKTGSGSLGFFVSAFLICLLLLLLLTDADLSHSILLAAGVALGSTLAEAVSHKGYDNLTIPVSVLLILLLAQIIISIG